MPAVQARGPKSGSLAPVEKLATMACTGLGEGKIVGTHWVSQSSEVHELQVQ